MRAIWCVANTVAEAVEVLTARATLFVEYTKNSGLAIYAIMARLAVTDRCGNAKKIVRDYSTVGDCPAWKLVTDPLGNAPGD
jgi:hypothetical protein